MFLRSLKVRHTGVFDDAYATFSRSASVIAGKNNSGKSTLLSAAAIQLSMEPQRNQANEDRRRRGLPPSDSFAIRELQVEERDLVELCRLYGEVAVPILAGKQVDQILESIRAGQLRISDVRGRRPQGPTRDLEFKAPGAGSMLLYHDGKTFVPKHQIAYQVQHASRFVELAEASVFRFDADRSRTSSRLVRPMPGIDQRGEELINAFNHLHAAERLRFLATARRVLPEIVHLEAVPAPTHGHIELRIWFVDDPRPELSFTLGEVGYGTPNVLALLFAATMEKRQRILLIDEPATFLHPGAVRELMRVLAEHPQHQYIFATHSFVGLEAFPEASFSLCVREPGQESATIANIGSGPAADGRRALREVGASLADVFGADRIIWTEGPSDADVLQLVLRDLKAPRGIAILPIIHTGDFDTRDLKPDHRGARRSLAVNIYQSLSKNSALIPPALAFVFDREKRNQTQLDDLKRQIEGNDPAKGDRPRFFLYDEFMLENLFLDADLIAALLNHVATDPERPATPVKPISAAAIEDLWNAHVDPKYPAPARVAEPEGWRMRVHGARVLEATFDDFFDSTVEFIKAKHAPVLARLALELDGLAAQRLRAFGKRILEAVKDREGSE